MNKQVAIEAPITVDEFAKSLEMKVTDVMAELMKNGVMATKNDTIDFETASIVAEDLGVEVVAVIHEPEAKTSSELEDVTVLNEGEGEARPPVVAVMGHVDHGKTTLLDALRESDVAAQEAGGITQHISAYQIHHGDRLVTFLDTPGHEAFSILRQHGARLTDVAIVVVAADDGIKPQTEETIRYVKEAGVRMVIALNKVDKPDADPNRVKQQLSEKGLMPEEWGGETVMVEISALKRQNLDKLIEMVLLVADLEDIRARYDGPGEGTVIESQMVRGKGIVATVLVQHGHFEVGNFIVAGDSYAKVRSLEDFNGQRIKRATPSMPVAVTGWKTPPKSAALAVEVPDEKTARLKAQQSSSGIQGRSGITQADALTAAMQAGRAGTVPVVIKADVNGSLSAIVQSLESLQTEEVRVEIVGRGVGPVSESDITLAESTNAHILAFNVSAPNRIKQLALRSKVKIKTYNVIYELIEDIRDNLSDLLEPEIIEEVMGSLEVKGVFKTAQKELICGGQVKTGKLTPGLLVRFKDGEEIGTLETLQREKQSAKEIVQGEVCGLSIATTAKVKLDPGDELEFFTRVEKERTL